MIFHNGTQLPREKIKKILKFYFKKSTRMNFKFFPSDSNLKWNLYKKKNKCVLNVANH